VDGDGFGGDAGAGDAAGRAGLREVLIYLYRRHPSRVTEVGLVHLDDAEITD